MPARIWWLASVANWVAEWRRLKIAGKLPILKGMNLEESGRVQNTRKRMCQKRRKQKPENCTGNVKNHCLTKCETSASNEVAAV